MWLYLPKECLPSRQVQEDLNAESLLFSTLASSATWRTKSQSPDSWCRTWKRAGWLPHLFGRTYEPSMVARGVASWMASLAATPASRSASPDGSEEQTTRGICGLTSPALSTKYNPHGASSRTSETICGSADVKSSETYNAWATALRRRSTERRKSAHRTDENGSSSSQWPTPRSSPNENRTTQHAPSHGKTHGKTLAGEAAQWATPTAGDGMGGQSQPSAARRAGGGDRSLRVAAAQWATPTSRDHKDGAEPSAEVATNSLLGRQAPRITRDGLLSLLPADWITSRLRLNPTFVEDLMGWPEDWSVLTVSESSGTA